MASICSLVLFPVLRVSLMPLMYTARAVPQPTSATITAATMPMAIFLPRPDFLLAAEWEYAELSREYDPAPPAATCPAGRTPAVRRIVDRLSPGYDRPSEE